MWQNVDMSDLEGEDIVCECARVSLRTIREVIRLNDLKTVQEITQYTKAGAFCKSCVRPGGHEERRYYLVDILNGTRKEMESERMRAHVEEKEFARMNLIQKHKVLETILDEKVRPNLLRDGGNLEVVDMKEQDEITEVYVHYLGACKGCPSAQTGTQVYIEEILHDELDERIKVVPV